MPFKLKLGSQTLSLPSGTAEIGRMADCWLTLDDELASRYHARLHVESDGLFVEDLGSRNGTFVNDEQIAGKIEIFEGDQIRIGRATISVLGPSGVATADDSSVRQTLAPGDDSRFPTLMSQLVEKSLKVGKLKDAERYALALTNQIATSRVGVEHPIALSCVQCLLGLAERTSDPVWIDRLFRLHAAQVWMMQPQVVEEVRTMLDRVRRVGGDGVLEYEHRLRLMVKEGAPVPSTLSVAVSEIADAYARR